MPANDRPTQDNQASRNRKGSSRDSSDPRILVPKEYGIGWTINMGHPHAKRTIVGLIVALFLVLSVLMWWAALRRG
jgi:hypothetical protein